RRVGHQFDEPVEAEQARVELLPTGVRLLREADPELLGIRDPEDARATVARAAVVVELELLVHRDLRAALPQRPRGRATHHARTDDRDLHRTIRSPGVSVVFSAAWATSRPQSTPGGVPSSGVVTTGPSVSAKSRCFAPRR